MPLTPEEEKRLREQIRKELEERERRARESKQKEEEERQRRLEERLRLKIREEEEERFYTEKGYVKYINHRGGVEWITPEEARAREERRRKKTPSRHHRSYRRRKLVRFLVNGALVLTALMVFMVLYRYNFSRKPVYGKVLVVTDIPGAQIYLDGMEMKGFTPDTLPRVKTGLHYISVYKEGYSAWPPMQRVAVGKSKLTEVRFALRGLAPLGEVIIETDRKPFRLFVDGVPHPVHESVFKVPVGYHVFTVVKKGFLSDPLYHRVLVEEGKPVTLRFQFQPLEEFGHLRVSANESQAWVYIDNQFSGFKANHQWIPVRPGIYDVRVRKNGYRVTPAYEMINILPGERHSLVFDLQPTAEVRKIAILTPEPGAVIILNGEWLPYMTPLKSFSISPGDHFLNLMRNGKLYSTTDVHIDSRRITAGELRFRF